MKLIVIEATGLSVGNHFVEMLVERGHEVHTLAASSTSSILESRRKEQHA